MADKLNTTHVVLDRELIVYRRERSSTWERATTKERDLKAAKKKADRLRVVAAIRKQENLPAITRKFSNVAKLAIERTVYANALPNVV